MVLWQVMTLWYYDIMVLWNYGYCGIMGIMIIGIGNYGYYDILALWNYGYYDMMYDIIAFNNRAM